MKKKITFLPSLLTLRAANSLQILPESPSISSKIKYFYHSESTLLTSCSNKHDEFSADVEKIYKQNLGYRFFVWAGKQPGYSHSHEAYKAMLRMLGKMWKFGSICPLVEEMRNESPEFLTADVMMKKAIEVLDEMPKYGLEPDENVFGCLLYALCKNGSVKEAAKSFDEMGFRFRLTIKHFTSLLYGWCKEGKVMEAKVVFVLMKMTEAGFKPDIVVYNNLLNGYAVCRKMADAFALLQEMRRKGCDPYATSFTIVIQALCLQDNMEEAMRVFLDMERSGYEADVITYTTLISGFCKWGKIGKGHELLDNMLQKGHNPNQTTYSRIMLTHGKKEDCLELVKEMEKINIYPDLSINNVVIRLACKLGEIDEGVRVLNQIEANGINHFKEMIGRGLLSAPQYGTLKDLLNSLLRAEKLELGKDVWSCIMTKGCELNTSAWTIWIHALFSNGYMKEACSYCLDMMDAGLMPQPDTFAKLMRGLRKLYNRQIASEITEKVRKMAEERNLTFKMYKRSGERDLKEKAKTQLDGRKTRDCQRRWGSHS
ncbi:unnamed protein product [Withania somnifera]